MSRLYFKLIFVVIGFQLMHCKSDKSVLNTRSIANYDTASRDHILFFEFKVSSRGKGEPEKVKLIRAVSGNGKMKNLRQPVHYPYQIRAVPKYNIGLPETEITLEHPLYKSVELPNQNGTLENASVEAREGVLSFRLQEYPNMERIELFSVTPENGSVKIYTLYLKQ